MAYQQEETTRALVIALIDKVSPHMLRNAEGGPLKDFDPTQSPASSATADATKTGEFIATLYNTIYQNLMAPK